MTATQTPTALEISAAEATTAKGRDLTTLTTAATERVITSEQSTREGDQF